MSNLDRCVRAPLLRKGAARTLNVLVWSSYEALILCMQAVGTLGDVQVRSCVALLVPET